MAPRWSPDSWRAKEIEQVPVYPDQGGLDQVEKQLTAQPAITVPAVTWTAWQMATSRQLTVARLPVTSPGPACTTRCPTRVTTFPRRLQTHSPARSWNWHIFDHNPPECDAPDSAKAHTLEFILLQGVKLF